MISSINDCVNGVVQNSFSINCPDSDIWCANAVFGITVFWIGNHDPFNKNYCRKDVYDFLD